MFLCGVLIFIGEEGNDMKKKTYEELIKESPVTYEAYANMVEDGNRYEISDGVLELMSPTPTVTHQSIVNEILFMLNNS